EAVGQDHVQRAVQRHAPCDDDLAVVRAGLAVGARGVVADQLVQVAGGGLRVAGDDGRVGGQPRVVGPRVGQCAADGAADGARAAAVDGAGAGGGRDDAAVDGQ